MAKVQKSRLFPQVPVQTLATLLAFCEKPTAREVAEQFGLSVSAVSRQMQELEKELNGVTLFKRSRMGMELTPNGAIYAEAAKRALAELDGARLRFDKAPKNLEGPVSIHISEVLVDDYLLPVIRDFTAEHPRTVISSTISPAMTAQAALLEHRTDLATIWGLEEHKDIEVVKKARYPLVAIVRADQKLPQEREVSPEAILTCGLPVALPQPMYASRIVFERLLRKSGVSRSVEEYPSVVLALNSFEHLQRFVLNHNAIAILPMLAASVWFNKPRLRMVRIAGADAEETNFALCRHRRPRPNMAAMCLFERLCKDFDKQIKAAEKVPRFFETGSPAPVETT